MPVSRVLAQQARDSARAPSRPQARAYSQVEELASLRDRLEAALLAARAESDALAAALGCLPAYHHFVSHLTP